MSRKIWINDTTLRDGMQTPGLVMDHSHRLQLGLMLAEAGVDELEAGIPAMGKEEQAYLSLLNRKLPERRISAWCRADLKDLYAAARCGLSSVHFAFPVSDRHLQLYKKDTLWLNEQMEEIILTARSLFPFVSVGAMDAFRTPALRLKRFAKKAWSLGASRVRIADTVGIATPNQVKRLFHSLGHRRGLLEFHGHNDLGLAAANSLAAVQGGAGSLSLTLNGVGERAGNAALEQMAAILYREKNFHCGLLNQAIKPLSEHLDCFAEGLYEKMRPILGENVFTHESGIHGHGMEQDQRSYCDLVPEDYGTRHRLVAGSHSGSHLIQNMLKRQGQSLSRCEAEALLPHIRRTIGFGKGYLEEKDLLDLYLSVKKNASMELCL